MFLKKGNKNSLLGATKKSSRIRKKIFKDFLRARPYLCVLYNKIVDFVYNWASLNLYKKCKERLCLSCTRPCLCAFAFLCISGLKSGALRSSLIREFWNKKISWKFFVQEMQSISLNKKLRTKAQRNKEILKEFLVQETPKRFFECVAFLGHKNCFSNFLCAKFDRTLS